MPDPLPPPPPPGNAELQLGTVSSAPISAPTWRSRGYLPHRDEVGLLQSITFRLADSLPQEKLRSLEQSLATLPQSSRDLEQRKQIEAWLDAGIGCCALRHPAVAATVEAALLHHDGERYRLLAWCIMPNHVHVLIQPHAPLAGIVQSWKSFTGRWALANNAELELGVPGKSLWMREYWDRYIRDETHLRAVIAYIHQNPVQAGLCPTPSAWPWSSARHLPPGTPSSSSAPSP
jgi:type I restriction enzyme R subunit/putative DNA methylase